MVLRLAGQLLSFVLVPAIMATIAWYAFTEVVFPPWACWLAALVTAPLASHYALRHSSDVFGGAPDARKLGIWLLAHSLVYLLIPVAMAITYLVFRGQLLFPMWPAILAGIGTAWVIAMFQRKGLPLWLHDQRGAKLTTHHEAMAKQRKLFKKGDPGIYWGDVLLPYRAATQHFCTMGVTRSGKTVTLKMLMKSVLPRIREKKVGRALIYDQKGDMVSYLAALGYRPKIDMIIFNPYDKRAHAWDLATDVSSRSFAKAVALILVPEDSTGEKYFPRAVRSLTSNALIAFSHAAKKTSAKWGLRDLLAVFHDPDDLWALLSSYEDTRKRTERIYRGKEFHSVVATIDTQLGRFEEVAAAWDHGQPLYSLTDWLKSNKLLVIASDSQAEYALRAINQTIFLRLSQLIRAQERPNIKEQDPDADRTWFFMDEARTIGKLEGLNELLTAGGSKGACVALGFQDKEGLDHEYDREIANEMLGQCNNRSFLRLINPNITEWVSQSIGDVEGWRKKSRAADAEEQLDTWRVVMPSELKQLPYPTNTENGLTAYYDTPYYGVYKHTIKGPRMFPPSQSQLFPDVNQEEPNYKSPFKVPQERDDYERLRIWTDEDYKTHGLKHSTPPAHPDYSPRKKRPSDERSPEERPPNDDDKKSPEKQPPIDDDIKIPENDDEGGDTKHDPFSDL